MGQRPLTDLGHSMLGMLPPVLRESADYQAVVHACAREVERLEGHFEQVRAQFDPAQADILLGAWEAETRLPIGGAGASIDQRRMAVETRLRQLLDATQGRQWEAQVTKIVGGPGWSYKEHTPTNGVPADTLQITLPFPASSPSYRQSQTQIRDITPAHLDLVFLSAGGFMLDESELDVDGLTY